MSKYPKRFSNWQKLGLLALLSCLSTSLIFPIVALFQVPVESQTLPNLLAQQSPPVWARCVPAYPNNEERIRLENVGQSRRNERTYYLLLSYTEFQGSTVSDDLIISSSGNDCAVELWNPMGDRIPYSEFVPAPVARELRLDHVRSIIDSDGVSAYEQVLQDTVNRGVTVDDLFPEEIWALQQLRNTLGVPVPAKLLPN